MSHAELCEHHARECLAAAGQSEDPVKREVLLRLALDWMAETIAMLKQPDSRHREGRDRSESHANENGGGLPYLRRTAGNKCLLCQSPFTKATQTTRDQRGPQRGDAP